MSNPLQKFTGLTFDASKIKPAEPLEPVPGDMYTVVMSDGSVVPTNDGTGKRLKFELTIMDGPFKGRKIWDGLNIENTSAKAQEIAQQQLSAICHAVNVINLTDVQQLYGKPFAAKIGLDPRRQDANDPEKWYDPRNTFKGAKPVEGGSSAPVSSGAPTPAWLNKPGAAASGAAPAAAPWLAKPAAAPAPAPTPAASVAAATGGAKAPAGPKSPAKPKPVEPKLERQFFVFFDENTMPLKKESEVATMLAEGMPTDTQISLADKDGGFDDNAGWHPVTKYSIGTATPPAASTPAGAAVQPPWLRK